MSDQTALPPTPAEKRMADALVHVQRAREAAGEPDSALPSHRATQVRQNLRFAADLLAPSGSLENRVGEGREDDKPSVEARVRMARDEIRADEPLPDWPPSEWVNGVTCKLGEAAYHAGMFANAIRRVFPGTAAESEMQFCEQMIAVAAVSMDAVEAMERG